MGNRGSIPFFNLVTPRDYGKGTRTVAYGGLFSSFRCHVSGSTATFSFVCRIIWNSWHWLVMLVPWWKEAEVLKILVSSDYYWTRVQSIVAKIITFNHQSPSASDCSLRIFASESLGSPEIVIWQSMSRRFAAWTGQNSPMIKASSHNDDQCCTGERADFNCVWSENKNLKLISIIYLMEPLLPLGMIWSGRGSCNAFRTGKSMRERSPS